MDEVLFKSADDRKVEGDQALEKEAGHVERAFHGFRACCPCLQDWQGAIRHFTARVLGSLRASVTCALLGWHRHHEESQ